MSMWGLEREQTARATRVTAALWIFVMFTEDLSPWL